MPWKPGESGNPRGRPVGSGMLTDALKRQLDSQIDDGRTKAERLAEVIVSAALEGNAQAWKICWDRIEGRVTEPPSDPDRKLQVQVVYSNDTGLPVEVDQSDRDTAKV